MASRTRVLRLRDHGIAVKEVSAGRDYVYLGLFASVDCS